MVIQWSKLKAGQEILERASNHGLFYVMAEERLQEAAMLLAQCHGLDNRNEVVLHALSPCHLLIDASTLHVLLRM